jgi:hypothetical protein
MPFFTKIRGNDVGLLLLLLCLISAVFAYKKRSPMTIAIAIALGATSWECRSGFDSYLDLLLTGLLAGGVCYAGLKIFLALRASQPMPNADEMNLILGVVLDTKNSSQVFSDVTLGRNLFGHLDVETTHEVVISHDTWLYDLNRNIEVNYSGGGTIKARPGHILGTMSWRGKSFLDINFTTNSQGTIARPNTTLVGSLIMGAALVVFGWAMFPLFALMAPLTWIKVVKWRGGGVFLDYVLPGSKLIEAVAVYLGGLVYVAFIAAFANANGHNYSVGTVIGCAFVFYVLLHQWVMHSLQSKYDALIAHGSQGLHARYDAYKVQQARALAEQTTPVA